MIKNNTNSRLVYSTDSSNVCPQCGKTVRSCKCRSSAPEQRRDGIVRIRREVKGRKGKTVTTISGIPASASEILTITSDLKRLCGCGGACKDGIVIIQGDHRTRIQDWLENKGYTVKQAGG